MKNFLVETFEAINEAGKTVKDVQSIFSHINKFTTTWNDFIKFANFEYDNENKGDYIIYDLVILFKDNSWLERDGYSYGGWWTHVNDYSEKNYGELSGKNQLINEDWV